jgi:hypothetical protein
MALAASQSVKVPGAPPVVQAALDRLKEDLVRAAGQNFAGLILYGGLARGRFRPGKSDVNVVVLLHDASGPALAAIAGPLATARRAAGVDALVLTPTEVARTADAFPTKFLDIKDHHLVLAGVNPFTQLEVTREQIRIRSEQEFRNMLLRLRRRYITARGDGLILTRALALVARPLAIELEVLLRLAGKSAPTDDRTAAMFDAAAAAFGLNREPLAKLAELRRDGAPDDDVTPLYHGVLEAIARAADVVDKMKEAPQ